MAGKLNGKMFLRKQCAVYDWYSLIFLKLVMQPGKTQVIFVFNNCM
jgi:hypothetical protein